MEDIELEDRQEEPVLPPSVREGGNRVDNDGKESHRTVPASDEVQRLRNELAASKQEVAASKRLRNELAASKQELAETKQELAETKKRLAKNKQTIESWSVKRLLEIMPTMVVNPACKPSITENDKAHEIVQRF